MSSDGFVGIDPAGLLRLADETDQCLQRIGAVGRAAALVLDRRSRSTTLRPTSVATALEGSAAGLRWRAGVIGRIQSHGQMQARAFPAARWLAQFAASAVFNTEDWREAYSVWVRDATLDRLEAMDPVDVAGLFSELDRDEAEALAQLRPDLIGPMDGAPPSIRYLANDILIQREIDRLGLRLGKIGDSWGGLLSNRILADQTEARIGELTKWLAEERRILLFDPIGDGRVVEVFGDLERANCVAVVVPGMANDLGNFSDPDGGFRTTAARLFEQTSAEGVATIAWLGYDPPDGVDAVARGAAETGAPALSRFLVGVDPDTSKRITVVAHSYGSVVAGLAAADGLSTDNLVVVGSPGTSLDRAADASLRSGGRFWSALAPGDPIELGVNPLDSIPWWHGLSPLLPLLTTCRLLGSNDELWHGPNPASPEFGAIRITTTGSSGHSEYFEATTLDNLVAIVEGRYSDVQKFG